MAILIALLLLDSWPVSYGRALVEELHSYDLLRHDVRVRPTERGLEVDARLTLRVQRAAPLRFLISREIADLRVEEEGRAVPAELGTGAFEALVRLAAPPQVKIPSLLSLRPDPAPSEGQTRVFRLRYFWNPADGGWQRATARRVQTHLEGFWLPAMADEFYDARLTVETELEAVAPGRRRRDGGAWVFETEYPLQVLPLIVAEFTTHALERKGRRLELLMPPGETTEPEGLLDDLAEVMEELANRFGPGPGTEFRLVVEPSGTTSPSFCGASFVQIARAALPDRAGRENWIALLAHECSHVWWGHRVAMPVIGRGGTFLREGLAQWSGLRVAGALLGPEAEQRLFRGCVRGYLGRVDLRRSPGPDGALFANEPTLFDATYLDPPAVPYLRGALVLRRLESDLGTRAFGNVLRRLAAEHAGRFVDLEAFSRITGAETLAYYAATSRLPDLELAVLVADPGRLRGRVRCRDLDWPGGVVQVEIETDRGIHRMLLPLRDGRADLEWNGEGVPRRVVVDPERIHLDPLFANNVWGKRR